jgi:hypothetical protein
MYIDDLSEASAAIMLAALSSMPEGDDILLDHVIAAALKELANRINNADEVKQDILDIVAELAAITNNQDADSMKT